jgi:hypothetical protein
VGDWRVGCIGLRSPGRKGGRFAVGAPGRGRWKIGWPGTGRPGAGRIVAPGGAPSVAIVPAGAAGRKGALYTGRGPVCGTIIRGGGAVAGGGALGATGLAVMVGGCGAGAVGRGGVAMGAMEPAEGRGAVIGGATGRGIIGATGAAD